jgi:cytochrome c oxidase subunit 3
MASQEVYYVPDGSKWPIIATLAIFTTFLGGAVWFNDGSFGKHILFVGLALVTYMFYGWFKDVIKESLAGKYSKQVDVSFRMGMGWFIVSEVMFFAAFFGALYYAREFSIPWLSGEGNGGHNGTHEFLWPAFQAAWPMNVMPDPSRYTEYSGVIPAFGVPALNTTLLLSSGVTVTLAHWALQKNNNKQLCTWLAATVLLGIVFLGFQIYEYVHAHQALDLTLKGGIYGSTFYLLTGFHGFHVSMGALMLAIILYRSLKGHFSKKDHFAFEAVAWYWHFVDVVWLGLFIFVYWI